MAHTQANKIVCILLNACWVDNDISALNISWCDINRPPAVLESELQPPSGLVQQCKRRMSCFLCLYRRSWMKLIFCLILISDLKISQIVVHLALCLNSSSAPPWCDSPVLERLYWTEICQLRRQLVCSLTVMFKKPDKYELQQIVCFDTCGKNFVTCCNVMIGWLIRDLC